MHDHSLERTPAFNKETAEDFENKLIKKIKIADQEKYKSQEFKSELKKSRLELIDSSKRKFSQDRIDRLLRMIKQSHQLKVDK